MLDKVCCTGRLAQKNTQLLRAAPQPTALTIASSVHVCPRKADTCWTSCCAAAAALQRLRKQNPLQVCAAPWHAGSTALPVNKGSYVLRLQRTMLAFAGRLATLSQSVMCVTMRCASPGLVSFLCKKDNSNQQYTAATRQRRSCGQKQVANLQYQTQQGICSADVCVLGHSWDACTAARAAASYKPRVRAHGQQAMATWHTLRAQ